MSATRTILLLLTSIFLCSIFWFISRSRPSLYREDLAKVLASFKHETDYKARAFSANSFPQYCDDPNSSGYVILEAVSVAERQNLSRQYLANVHDFDEKDVVMLSKKNFSDFVVKNKHVIVNFRRYWGKVPALEEYAATATRLKGRAVVARINYDDKPELARKHRIEDHANLYFFVNGVHVYTYPWEITRNLFLSWIEERMQGGVLNVTTSFDAIGIRSQDSMRVVGFLHDLEGPESEELVAASNLTKGILFYQTACPRPAQVLSIDPKTKRPALFMLRTGAKDYIRFDGHFTRSEIADFVAINKLPLVTSYSMQNAYLILENPMKQVWLFATSNESGIIMPAFEEAAEAFNGKLLFVHADLDDENVRIQLSYAFGLAGYEASIIACTGPSNEDMKQVMEAELTLSNIMSFAEDFLEDKLLSLSQPISSTDPTLLQKS